MNQKRIVVTDSPVTTVIVDGRPHHYFHSEKLGKCRAILIRDDENLEAFAKPYAAKPLSKGKKLEALMDCGERLQKRYDLLWDKYQALPESDRKSRNALFTKIKRVYQANTRISLKIALLLGESR